MVGRGNIAFVNLLIRPLRLHGLELRKFALPLKRKSTLNGNLQATLILFTEVSSLTPLAPVPMAPFILSLP
jgi:hypothetical protein